MKNLKDKFIDYLLGKRIYRQYLDTPEKCEKFISELEDEYEKAFGKILFNDSMDKISLAKEIKSNLNDMEGTSLEIYNQKKNSGVPHAILQSHLLPFLHEGIKKVDRNQLYEDFQNAFPLESLETMSLEKYTNLKREDSFCYWVENRTYNLGSFWGGSSYKFGIYKYNKRPDDVRIQSDDEYAWYKKYNKYSAEEAFALVREAIVRVAHYARNGEFDQIEKVDLLGEAYKWEIAFLYSEKQLVPVYKREKLDKLAKHFGMEHPEEKKVHELQAFLFPKKGEKDLFDFYEELIPVIDSKDGEQRFWLLAPGEGARKWKEFQTQNLMSIGWDELGNLEDYEDFEDIRKALQEVYQRPNSSCKNDALAVWNFCNEMKPGDVVYVKGGQNLLLGRGVIDSGYCFDDSLEEYKHIRKMKWTHRGEWIVNRPLVQKTLTEITKKTEDIKSFDAILNAVSEKEASDVCQYWWLVCNPKIWTMRELEVGKTIEYSLYSDSGAKRRVFQNFLDAKKGDRVIAYESTPTKQIIALAEVECESDEKSIIFKKMEALVHPVDYSILKGIPELADMQFMQNAQGSLFKLTAEEYDTLMEIIRGDNPLIRNNEVYTKKNFLDEVFISEADYEHLTNLLEVKKNVILQGAPGVGKTFSAKRLAYAMMGEKDDTRIEMVQFHQNYSYEDFIMGYKPNAEGGFELKKGVFYNFCKRAMYDRKRPYFFIVDEINRGNLSKIFGELMMLIENDYRGTEIKLAYSDEPFAVPKNVYILGMMNTADRSIAFLDYALRRRFSFFKMKPGFDTVGFKNKFKDSGDDRLNALVNTVKRLNEDIANDTSLGEGFQIGHSYFCKSGEVDDKWLYTLVEFDLIPMLEEYWFDNETKFEQWSEELRMVIK